MAKSARPLQRTPASARKNAPEAESSDSLSPAHPAASAQERRAEAPAPVTEPDYLLQGTGCVAGHERGQELVESRLGRVPSARLTKIGFGVTLWIAIGVIFIAPPMWSLVALIGGVLWTLYSLFVQHRGGHRGHCRRTRAWRYAWGGLVPTKQQR